MNEIKVIDKTEILGKEIQVFGDYENPLFLAKDVASWIEHNKPSEMISNVDEDEKLKAIVTHAGQNREMWLLNEEGLYETLMQSRKPIAKEFKKKIKIFLKELRTGKKVIANKNKKEELLLQLFSNDAMTIANAHKKLVELETKPLLEKIEEDRPLVGFAKTCIKSSESILVRELAKLACDEGINIGQNKLYDKLRQWNYILKSTTEPTQYAINMGYFEVVQGNTKTPYGIKTWRTTKVKARGQVQIIEKLKKELEDE